MAPTGPDALGDTVQYRLPGKSSVYPGSSGAFFLPQIADLLVSPHGLWDKERTE